MEALVKFKQLITGRLNKATINVLVKQRIKVLAFFINRRRAWKHWMKFTQLITGRLNKATINVVSELRSVRQHILLE